MQDLQQAHGQDLHPAAFQAETVSFCHLLHIHVHLQDFRRARERGSRGQRQSLRFHPLGRERRKPRAGICLDLSNNRSEDRATKIWGSTCPQTLATSDRAAPSPSASPPSSALATVETTRVIFTDWRLSLVDSQAESFKSVRFVCVRSD